MAIRVCTLPGPRVLAAAGEVTGLRSRNLQLAVVTYLAVERRVPRDRLLSVFWPERGEERARHSLSQVLYELRRALGDEWLEDAGDVVAVAATVTSDVADFESSVQAARWAQALELYGGGFLEGLHLASTRPFEEWVDGRRAQVARLHRRARRELVADRLRLGDVAGALAAALRWAELEPLDDEAQQRAIELLARSGRRVEALRLYEAFEARLRSEELEPMPELAQVVAAIRAGGPEASTPGSAGAGGSRPLVEAPIPSGAAGPLPGLAPDLEVVRLLAEGSSARVFLARERSLGRMVAIKVLSPASMKEPVLLRRFEREARAIARIQHPNVAPIFRLDTLTDGTRYLVMPYIDGGSLEDRLAARGPLAPPEARRVLAQLAAALSAAHAAGIIHRDVRPANVLYDRAADRVLLVDFGTAGLLDTGDLSVTPLTRPGEALGLPAYASPEQLRGELVTDRSDVYSLGVLAFEILTGRLPFEARSPVEMVSAHLDGAPASLAALRPDIDPALATLVQRCLHKRPEQRPYAKEIVEALAQ